MRLLFNFMGIIYMNLLFPPNKIAIFVKKIRCFLAFLILLQLSLVSGADISNVKEYQIKAVFWYNFTKFITWPEATFKNNQSPFYMCILGTDPFRGEMELAIKEAVSERPLEIKYLSTIETAETCHTVFISRSEQKQLPSLLNTLKKSAILTVSDIENFSQQGGMIEFYHENNKVRFMIAPEVLSEAGLRAQAQLLKISKIVKRNQ
jgi:hypothetical protein